MYNAARLDGTQKIKGYNIRGSSYRLFSTGKKIHLTPINKSVARRPRPVGTAATQSVEKARRPSPFSLFTTTKTKGVLRSIGGETFLHLVDGEKVQKDSKRARAPTPSNVSKTFWPSAATCNIKKMDFHGSISMDAFYFIKWNFLARKQENHGMIFRVYIFRRHPHTNKCQKILRFVLHHKAKLG